LIAKANWKPEQSQMPTEKPEQIQETNWITRTIPKANWKLDWSQKPTVNSNKPKRQLKYLKNHKNQLKTRTISEANWKLEQSKSQLKNLKNPKIQLKTWKNRKANWKHEKSNKPTEKLEKIPKANCLFERSNATDFLRKSK
jgi:hypothetical protein